MQNLIKYLKDFNSKERFFLVGQILGNPSFTLASEFREKLSDLLEIPIPADALSAMDYHIDWLYARSC
jgi:predicted ATP-grasp superfamily ATP-dependent carboligase